MMATQIREAAASTVFFEAIVPAQQPSRPSLVARMAARVFAARYDAQIEAGAVPAPGSSVEAHALRLASLQERFHLANSLIHLLNGLPDRAAVDLFTVRSRRIEENRELVEELIVRLQSLRPVGVKGMARLRMLIADGTGALYCEGSGSLAAELKGVLAALG